MRRSSLTSPHKVYFNGSEVLYIVDADDVEGWIDIIDENMFSRWSMLYAHGHIKVDTSNPEFINALPTVRRYGKVVFSKAESDTTKSKEEKEK